MANSQAQTKPNTESPSDAQVLAKISAWLDLMHSNQFDKAEAVPTDGVLGPISAGLKSLSRRMKSSLAASESEFDGLGPIRYEIAIQASEYQDMDDLLLRTVHFLRFALPSQAAMIWLIEEDGKMCLASSTGLTDEVVCNDRFRELQRCMCESVAADQQMLIKRDIKECELAFGSKLFPGQEAGMGMMVVPLVAQGKTIGVFDIFCLEEDLNASQDLEGILRGIAHHMSVALENARLQEQSSQKTIMEERLRIAHELHDSLAQTMASIRFQVRVLDESLHGDNESDVWQQLETVEDSLDLANTELRELIAHFRAPRDKRELGTAVKAMLQKFGEENDTRVHIHDQWGAPNLPKRVEMQVYRIVQEALSNVRKHSEAKNVRCLLRNDGAGSYHVLLEDDGRGIDPEKIDDFSNHFGLKIMRERGQKIGGELTIDSEPGEGTQVSLSFRWNPVAPVPTNL